METDGRRNDGTWIPTPGAGAVATFAGMTKRALFTVALLGALTACGFQPLYAKRGPMGGTAGAELAKIRIANIPDRTGQYLRNALIDRMQPQGPSEAAYRLEISLLEQQVNLGIQQDATATRGQLRYTGTYVLRDGQGKELLREGFRASPSFNIIESEFGTILSSEDARERGLKEIADDITSRLAMYFTREPKAG
jgi:LPS-assembly lipoprotein